MNLRHKIKVKSCENFAEMCSPFTRNICTLVKAKLAFKWSFIGKLNDAENIALCIKFDYFLSIIKMAFQKIFFQVL